MTDTTPAETHAATSTAAASSWTGGPFPPLWLAVLGSLAVLGQFAAGLCLVGTLVSLVVARRRPWVAAVAIVLSVWSGTMVLFTGRLLPWAGF
ncbi:hypothetical protein APR04_002135 [Promicromonospora umidemergens]|uniref:Uncharacterized protein n=1 Tax=Promicromonospora umidemergens TaxID=629679 RepID=A0ABP8WQA8_9MICO|nr:hypothetical protein [Promicromonospora umidemergens]MCP2283232.1 hypothetical protein [Promicromonospora umidemergens]